MEGMVCVCLVLVRDGSLTDRNTNNEALQGHAFY